METPWFAECALCRQGVLLAVALADTGEIQLICDECESMWRSPSEAASQDAALGPLTSKIRSANFQEITTTGWKPLGYL
jgi:hypothetical protein